ncbi:MAG: 50S ribosomal protein L17 [Chloroflexi bacterium]|nr:50S ribosomal protein L17 [Chloroflexota bacterium]
MRHRVAGRSLGRLTNQRMALYRNLTRDLLLYGHIVTTEAKAKETRTFAEPIITLGKQGTVAARRRALMFVADKDVIQKVFDELAGRYRERAGGYTRITHLGPRLGDSAPLVRLELV